MCFNTLACTATPSVPARVHSTGSMCYGTEMGRAGSLPPGLILFVESRCGWPVSRVLSRAAPEGGAGMAIHLGPRSPAASCGLPGQRTGGGPGPDALSSLFDLAPGGACRAAPVAGGAVGSYPTVSPLPEPAPAVCSLWRFPWGSGSTPSPAGRYPAPCLRGARTFLAFPPEDRDAQPSGHPQHRPRGLGGQGQVPATQGQRAARRSRCPTPARCGAASASKGRKRIRKARHTARVSSHHSPLPGAP